MILIAIVFVLATVRIYEISGGSGGSVLWNTSEAYFLVEVSDLGYRATGLEYPWLLLKRYLIGGFAAAEIPVDQRAYLVVIRITASGVERHTLNLANRLDGGPGGDPSQFTPLNGRIYASCPSLIGHFIQNDGQIVAKDDSLCWWSVDHFEKATQEEQSTLQGLLTKADFEQDKSGWSRRTFGATSRDLKFTLDVGDKFRLSVNNVARRFQDATVSIAVVRPQKPAETIGTFEAHQGRVSSGIYRHAFYDAE
jgi:hypothetical protein